MTNALPSQFSSGIANGGKQFTEKWLQALSLSANNPAAQRIKPLLNDIDCLCMQRSEDEQLSAASRLWAYAEKAGLRPLLEAAPYQIGEWRFHDEEAFVFERSDTSSDLPFEDWTNGLGLKSHRLPMTAIVNQDDWSEIVRLEAIRLGKPLSVIGMPPAKESLLWLNCRAEWDRNNWVFHFENPNWITKTYEGGFEVARPELSELEARLSEAIGIAIQNLSKGTATIPNIKLSEQPWMHSIPRLLSMHQKVITRQANAASPWFFRTWFCVWPVIYREQNRLQGACDIESIRRDLEACFRNVPELTVWMFAFSKLICLHQVGGGLGISGDFK